MSVPLARPSLEQPHATLQRLQRISLVLFFSFLLLIVLAGILHLTQQYNAAIDETMRSARASIKTADSYTSRTMAETYRVLEGIGDFYSLQLQHKKFDEYDLHQVLADRKLKLPHVATVFVLNANRDLVAASGVFPFTAATTDDVRRTSAPPTEIGNGLFVGELYSSAQHTANGARMYLPVGVKIEHDGKIEGYVVAVTRPDFFGRFFDTLDVGPSGTVDLWHSNGTLIAASKNSKFKVGESYPELAKRLQNADVINQATPETVYEVTRNSTRKIQGGGRIADTSMTVMVILESEDYLRAWRGSRNNVGLAIVVLVAAMTIASFFLFGQLKRTELNERELRQAKAVAEEANDAKSRFLAHMSHEFRTPLNAIMGFSEIISNKVLGEGVSAVYVSYADHIHKSGVHLLNIVNDILDVAKIESGSQSLQAEKVNVLAVTEAAVAFVDRMANERSLRIVVNIPTNLPRVIADERYLRQVLINLITNAVKFSAPGQDVIIEARGHASGLDILVNDHGPGIDDSVMRRIGEPFLQGNPTVTHSGQGAGLGLSICKQYMELLGGELLMTSAPTSGTTATVRFPTSLLAESPLRIASAAE